MPRSLLNQARSGRPTRVDPTRAPGPWLSGLLVLKNRVPVFRVPRRGLQGYWRGAIVFRCYGLGFRVSRFGILGSGGGV